MLPLVVDLSFLQLLGSPKVQSGLSASKEVDISNRSTAIIVFTITFPFIVGWQNIAATTRITSFLNVRFTLTKPQRHEHCGNYLRRTLNAYFRPKHVIRQTPMNGKYTKSSFSIELEPKAHPILVLLEPSYQRLRIDVQSPDSGKGYYCAVAGAAGAAGACPALTGSYLPAGPSITEIRTDYLYWVGSCLLASANITSH